MEKSSQSTLRFCPLADGRRLAYEEYGAPDGQPVFYFHGFPGSRLQIQPAHQPAQRRGLRIISVDRPGIGQSDFQPGRRLRHWPRDMEALATHLGLARFSILGLSGGAPYALACAHDLAERLDRVVIISGLGPVRESSLQGMTPFARAMLNLARHAPAVGAGTGYAVAWLLYYLRKPGYPLLLPAMPPHDRAVLRRPEIRALLLDSTGEALRREMRGSVHELRVYTGAWEFRPEDIDLPVQMWHGDADTIVPFQMARQLAARIPRAQFKPLPQAGHYSIIYGRLEDVLAEL